MPGQHLPSLHPRQLARLRSASCSWALSRVAPFRGRHPPRLGPGSKWCLAWQHWSGWCSLNSPAVKSAPDSFCAAETWLSRQGGTSSGPVPWKGLGEVSYPSGWRLLRSAAGDGGAPLMPASVRLASMKQASAKSAAIRFTRLRLAPGKISAGGPAGLPESYSPLNSPLLKFAFGNPKPERKVSPPLRSWLAKFGPVSCTPLKFPFPLRHNGLAARGATVRVLEELREKDLTGAVPRQFSKRQRLTGLRIQVSGSFNL